MKSGIYYTNPKRKKSIKILNPLFKYNFTIELPKVAIIIMVCFLWFSYGFPNGIRELLGRVLEMEIQEIINLEVSMRFVKLRYMTQSTLVVLKTTNVVYGTTNADAGVGIGMKRGDSEIWQKRPLISR